MGREAVQLEAHGRGLRPARGRSEGHSAEEWCAWARGPNKERLEGRGTGSQDALLELTVKLKELRA